MTMDDALALVLAELNRAQTAHPAFHSGHEGYAVIREELDELWDAIKSDRHYLQYSDGPAHEAIQVAAMAVRFLVDLCDADGTRAFLARRQRARA